LFVEVDGLFESCSRFWQIEKAVRSFRPAPGGPRRRIGIGARMPLLEKPFAIERVLSLMRHAMQLEPLAPV
jgi:hypothetical protein